MGISHLFIPDLSPHDDELKLSLYSGPKSPTLMGKCSIQDLSPKLRSYGSIDIHTQYRIHDIASLCSVNVIFV